MDKVKQVADHVNMILRYIPYIQTNFVLGLDTDEGPEPFELTKRFLDLAPGAFPAYSLLSAFGRAAPLNLEYQRAGRVLPFPFTFLNNNHAMNVRPKNYAWPRVLRPAGGLEPVLVLLAGHPPPARRHRGRHPEVDERGARDVVGGVGPDRVPHARSAGCSTRTASVRGFMEGETDRLPAFYAERIEHDLGPLVPAPAGGRMMHDPNAYLKSTNREAIVTPLRPGRRRERVASLNVLENATPPA